MTEKELYEGLKSLGYPVTYSHFAEGEAPELPYITYLQRGTDNFAADGIVHLEVPEYDIELYSDGKNLEAEAAISEFLTANGVYYDKQEAYIESQKMIQVVFEINLV